MQKVHLAGVLFYDGLTASNPYEGVKCTKVWKTGSNIWTRAKIHQILYPISGLVLSISGQDLAKARSAIHRETTSHISWNSVRTSIVQELDDHDCSSRNDFANCCLQIIQSDALVFNRIIWSDECVFGEDKIFKKYDVRILGTEIPREKIEITGGIRT